MKYLAVVAGVALVVIIIVVIQNRLSPTAPTQTPGEERYVPLGDSYTIGTSIDPADNFPTLLTRDLAAHEVKVKLVSNTAEMGWTSQQLIANELPIFDKAAPTFTTVLVGVNDFNRGVPQAIFQKNLGTILDHVQAVLPDKNKVVVITIPDFSVTPTGKTYGNPKQNSVGVAEFNSVIVAEAEKRGLKVVDVFPLSQQMGNDKSLVASDGLHPSAKEYRLWEKLIFPVASKLLRGR